MVQGKDFMFHSCLSTSINIGLLNPLEIIEEIRSLEKTIPLNSYEGYIRQLFWREYQRYTYLFCNFSENYFGNKKKLGKEWYDGTTGCDPWIMQLKQVLIQDTFTTFIDLWWLEIT